MSTWPHDDLPAPGRFSLARVLAARKGHATRRADLRAAQDLRERFPQCDGACEAGRGTCSCRPAEMAVYSPENDDAKRERMTATDSWVLLAAYVLSASFVAWALSVLAAFFKALPR